METDEKQRKNTKRRVLIAVVSALVAAIVLTVGLLNYFLPFRTLFLPAAEVPPRGEGEMRFHFLDVGQADCTIVEFPDGKTLVVDGGSSSRESEDKVASYLFGLGSPRLTIVATHADLDHFGGFSYLLETFEVEKAYLPILPSEAMEYTEFLSDLEEEGCETETLSRYKSISGGDAFCMCLSPYSAGETEENDASTVLYFDYMGVQTVLSSDISAEREKKLVLEYGLMEGIFDADGHTVRLEETDVLKAAHHGSGGSSCAEWLSLLGPKETVISCGKGNPYRHPALDTLLRLEAVGSAVYRTDTMGDILLTISPDGTYRFTASQTP